MFHRNIFIFVSACLFIALSSCSIPQLREAETVVAQADSLWHEGKMYGVDMGDSATLAQAYHTITKYTRFPYTLFSPRLGKGVGGEVSYHYGRLLRAKNDPVAAMQVFINATHSRTKNYHILGRIYSNMGDICHLAGEFPLAYDMYERSGDMYLHNGDTLLYYYGLNAMAFEQVEANNNHVALVLLDSIRDQCEFFPVIVKTIETRLFYYRNIHQYDSVLAYCNLLSNWGIEAHTILISKAQAYFHLQIYDSAFSYAQKTINETQSLFEKDNAYYILIHCDSVLSNHVNVYNLSANRADVQKQIEIRQGKLSQAVQLLEQDLTKKPDYRWLYAIAIALVVVGVIIVPYTQYKHKRRKLLSRQIEGLAIQNKEAEAQHANLTKEIDTLSQLHDAHHKEIVADIERFCALMRSNQDLREHLHWNNFADMCTLSDRYLYNIVTRLQPYNLSQKELRLCILVLLKANTNQMVDMIPYAQSGLGKFKYTTSNKLGTTTPNLRTFLLSLLG